ncbi:FixH family protein [Lutibacter sp.]|uniref:FixH family protein n=1 Tax=Lutibacter sp. TaxID=1925666 RepID=UPI0027322FE8|nr:FixH family protein [Lutibacter sp.]MDP3313563.1 FixH family protein [Lutibacter sp.]
MKIKISWPAGIIIAMSAFMLFILSFVIRAAFIPQYEHHLVSEDYYKDELNYQGEIDKLNRGIELKENVYLKKVDDGLLIVFPKEFNFKTISGTIKMQRLSNDKIDFNVPIKLASNEFLIQDKDLVTGRWDVKIEWNVGENAYMFKEKIMY